MDRIVQPFGDFPLKGVIGIVSESAYEIELAKSRGLRCVELRADLLLSNGMQQEDLFNLVKAGKKRELGVLFTLRHPMHGGTFQGSEDERVAISLKAMEAGADLFDLEWGTKAAHTVPNDVRHMVLSYHDFSAMPTDVDLQELTAKMEGTGARAIKVVPTASRLEDALAMLKWVSKQSGSSSRIGFAMGESGACSRILTTVLGGIVTYASFTAPVAPGQIDMDELLSVYRVSELNRECDITAVCVDNDIGREKVLALNKAYAGSNRVAVGFAQQDKPLLEACSEWMPLKELICS